MDKDFSLRFLITYLVVFHQKSHCGLAFHFQSIFEILSADLEIHLGVLYLHKTISKQNLILNETCKGQVSLPDLWNISKLLLIRYLLWKLAVWEEQTIDSSLKLTILSFDCHFQFCWQSEVNFILIHFENVVKILHTTMHTVDHHNKFRFVKTIIFKDQTR